MVQFERSEEETIQALKDWWKENGKAVIAGVLLGIGGIVGVRYWFDFQAESRQQASQRYGQLQMALQGGEREQGRKQVEILQQDYAATVYASLAALEMARLALEAGDAGEAESQLRWVLEHSEAQEYRHLARQRLARLLLSRGQPSEAAGLLRDLEEGGYRSIYAEIRGDIEVAQKQPQAARSHYQSALLGASEPLRRQLLEMKLAELPPTTGAADSEVSQ